MSDTVLRIGNASGFYGDRYGAVREMLEGGELDYLTGDYLAELTMLILGRDRMKDPALGYARTFLRQMEDTLALALERGVRIVTNAGGLNPAALAERLREVAEWVGVPARIAYVEGDDLTGRAAELGFGSPVAANAYLGGFGIAECLAAGADLVVTGRVTDASLVVGPGIAEFGWTPADLDPLAGAVAAGHVIECGTQATGGNFPFFTEIADLHRPGFPVAELRADGSSVITKHPGTGGAVTADTVTAQLLYEVTGSRYLGPDVTLRLDSVRLEDLGGDRVAMTGVRGEAPPETLKVSLNTLGGFRNEVTFVLTGLDIEAKAALVRSQLAGVVGEDAEWTLARTDHADAGTTETASALLHCVVRSEDADAVGRRFSGAAVEVALGSYPGFHLTAPPAAGTPYGRFSTGYVAAAEVPHVAVLPDGSRVDIAPVPAGGEVTQPETSYDEGPGAAPAGRVRRVPLGTIVAARSGDKGGSANVGTWVREDRQWPWLRQTLTTGLLRELLPETRDLPISRYELPNLRAVNFVIEDLLGEGVAYQARFDPQAKALAEWLRSRHVEIPEELLP